MSACKAALPVILEMPPPIRRSIQILIRQQSGDVERSIFTCHADITFGELFLDIKQKRSKSYDCTAVHVTGMLLFLVLGTMFLHNLSISLTANLSSFSLQVQM